MSEMGTGGTVESGISLSADESGLVKAITNAVDALDKLEKSVAGVTQALEVTFTKMADDVTRASTSIQESMGSISNAMKDMDRVLSNTGTGAEKVGQSMQGTASDVTNVDKAIRPTIATLDRLQAQFMKVNESSNRIGDAAGSFNEVSSSMAKYSEWVDKGFTSTQEMNAATAALTREFQEAIAQNTQYEQTMLNLEKSIGAADREISGMVARLQSMGDSEQYITQLNVALAEYKNSITEAAGDTAKIVAAKETYKNKIQEVKNALAAQGKGTSELAAQNHALQKSLQNVTKSVQLALGPLSGIAARVTAFTAILKTNAPAVALFTASLVGLTIASGRVIKAGMEYERQMLGMQSVIESTGRGAEITAESLSRIAEEVAEVTLSSTAGTRQAAVALSTFENVATSSFQNILEAAQGMSSAFGGNLVTNTRMLGRALESPIRGIDALRRAGIIFNDKQREMIRTMQSTGDIAGAQGVVMQQLAAFQKLARDEAAGLAGQLDTLGERFFKLTERVGTQVGANEKLGAAFGVLNERMKEILEGADQVDALTQVIGKAIESAAWAVEFFANNMNVLIIVMGTVFAAAATRTAVILGGLVAKFFAFNVTAKTTVATLWKKTKASYAAGNSLTALASQAGRATVTLAGLGAAARVLIATLPLIAGAAVFYSLVKSIRTTNDAATSFERNLDHISDSSAAATKRIELMNKQVNLNGVELRKNIEEQVKWLNYQKKGIDEVWSSMKNQKIMLEEYADVSRTAFNIADVLYFSGALNKVEAALYNAFGLKTANQIAAINAEIREIATSMDDDIKNGVEITADRIIALQELFNKLGKDVDVSKLVDQTVAIYKEQLRLNKASEDQIKSLDGIVFKAEELRDTFKEMDISPISDAIEQLNKDFEVEIFAKQMEQDVVVGGKIMKGYEALYLSTFETMRDKAYEIFGDNDELLQQMLAKIKAQETAVQTSLANIANQWVKNRTSATTSWISEFNDQLDLAKANAAGAKEEVKRLEEQLLLDKKVNDSIKSLNLDMANTSQVAESMGIIFDEAKSRLNPEQLAAAMALFRDGVFDTAGTVEELSERVKSFMSIIVADFVKFDRVNRTTKDFADTIYDLGEAIQKAAAYRKDGSKGFIDIQETLEEKSAIRDLGKTIKDMSDGALMELAKTYGLAVTAGKSLRSQVLDQMTAIVKLNIEAAKQEEIYTSITDSMKELSSGMKNTQSAYQALLKGGVKALDAELRKQTINDELKEMRENWAKLTTEVDRAALVKELQKEFPKLTITVDNYIDVMEELTKKKLEQADATEKLQESYENFKALTEELILAQQTLNDEFDLLRNGKDIIGAQDIAKAREFVKEFEKLGPVLQQAKMDELRQVFPDLFNDAQNFEEDMVTLLGRQRVQKQWVDDWQSAQKEFQDIARKGFHDIFDNGVDGFKGMIDNMIDMFNRMLIDMVYEAAMKEIVLNISANATGQFMPQGGQGGMFGSGGGAGQLMQLGNAFRNFTNSDFFGAIRSGYAAGEGFMGGISGAFEAGGNYIGNLLGGASDSLTGGFSWTAARAGSQAGAVDLMGQSGRFTDSMNWGNVGSILQGIQGALLGYERAGIGGALVQGGTAYGGAVLGGALGNILLPGIGGAIGSALGGALGSALGGLFGGSGEQYDGISSIATGRYDPMTGYEFGSTGKWKNGRPESPITGSLVALNATFVDRLSGIMEFFNVQEEFAVETMGRIRRTSGDFIGKLNVLIGDELVEMMTRTKVKGDISKGFDQFADEVMGKGLVDAIMKLDVPDFLKEKLQGLTGAEEVNNMIDKIVINFYGVNTALEQLGFAAYELNDQGLRASDALINLAGGLDEFNSKVNEYYTNFFSPMEQLQYVMNQVGSAFDSLNLSVPQTNAEFRSIVEGLDMTTDEGMLLFTALMEIAPAFAEVTKATDAMIAGFGVSADGLGTIISEGLLGKSDSKAIGDALSDMIVGGLRSAVVSGFSDQIRNQIMEGVFKPMMMAAITGGSIVEAVSADTIEAMIANAESQVAALELMMGDEGFNNLLSRLNEQMARLGEIIGDPAITSIVDESDAMIAKFGVDADALGTIISDGLLDKSNSKEVGDALSEMIVGGLRSAVVSGFSNQIRNQIMEGVFKPMMMAAITGGSIVEAVSADTIDAMIANAESQVAALELMMGDEGFNNLLSRLNEQMGRLGEIIGAAAATATTDIVDLAAIFTEMMGISVNNIQSAFQFAMENATNRFEAGIISAAGTGEMLIEGMSNLMMGAVSDVIYHAVVEPLINSIITAAVQGATIDLQGSATSAAFVAKGGEVAGHALMQGGAVAADYLAGITNQAVSTIRNISAILSDPAMQEAMRGLAGVMQTVGAEMYDGIGRITDQVNRAIPQMGVWNNLQAQRNAQDEAANDIAAERLNLENQWLQAVGNNMELRKRELAELHPSNRALQEAIWNFQDLEKAVNSLMNKALAAAKERIGKLSEVVGSLDSAMKSFSKTTAQYSNRDRELASNILRDALNGINVNNKDFKNALDTLTSNDIRTYSSMTDYMRDQMRAQSLIGTLLHETETQLTIEEMTLKSIEDQIAATERQHEENLDILMQQLEMARITASQFAGVNHNLDRVSAILGILAGSDVSTGAPSASSIINGSASDIIQSGYNNRTSGDSGNTDIVNKLNELKSELEHIRAGNVQIAKNTGRSLDIERKWDSSGLPSFRDGLVVDGGSF